MVKIGFAFLIVILTTKGASSMQIPSQVKQVVAFVYVLDQNGQLKPNGTGFFVGVPHPTTADTWYVYLVTAKHVLRQGDTGPFYSKVSIRLDKKSGGTDSIDVQVIPDGTTK